MQRLRAAVTLICGRRKPVAFGCELGVSLCRSQTRLLYHRRLRRQGTRSATTAAKPTRLSPAVCATGPTDCRIPSVWEPGNSAQLPARVAHISAVCSSGCGARALGVRFSSLCACLLVAPTCRVQHRVRLTDGEPGRRRCDAVGSPTAQGSRCRRLGNITRPRGPRRRWESGLGNGPL